MEPEVASALAQLSPESMEPEVASALAQLSQELTEPEATTGLDSELPRSLSPFHLPSEPPSMTMEEAAEAMFDLSQSSQEDKE
jgi:hypothetical protein